jgi:hypothetical protein
MAERLVDVKVDLLVVGSDGKLVAMTGLLTVAW